MPGGRVAGIIIPAFQRQLATLVDRLSQRATSDDLELVATSAEEFAEVNADIRAASNSCMALSPSGTGGSSTDRSPGHPCRY
jgi:hypothetical protein